MLGAKGKRLTVLHIGDSHLQNENLPNQSRKLFQAMQGDAGIGLIVPFSTVKSYDARFYKSTHTGTWKYSKSYMSKFDYPMGVRGMTSYTSDTNATFKMTFSQNVSSANNELVVFRHDNDSVFEMDETSMMPARTLSELDGLVAGGNDQGSVISSAPGEFTITNTIDLSKYVTVYTLDAEGRITKSVISSDDEPLGEITYTYSVTKEGKAALTALKETS